MRKIILFALVVLGLSFAGNVENCYRIDSPGIYSMNGSYGGAYYDTGTGMNACMVINSSNVVFDCAGHSITGYGDSIGVFLNQTWNASLSNVTVKNCAISNYQYGIYSWSSYPYPMHGCQMSGNNLSNVNEDLLVILADGCSIDNNRLAKSTNLQSISGSSIQYNSMEPQDSCYGIFLGAIWANEAQFNDNDLIQYNNVSNCYDTGFDFDYLTNSTVRYNGAYGNWYSGFDFSECSNNLIAKNTAANNSLEDLFTAGFVVYGNNNTIEKNIAENNSNGFDLFYQNNTLRQNHAFHNLIGMTLEGKSSGNTVDGNLLEDNVYVDLIVAGNAREMIFNRIGCANKVTNNTGSGGRQIYYSNQTGTVLGSGTYSEVILCGANQSSLSGVTVAGSDDFANNGFMIVLSPNTTMENLVSDGNAAGVWLYGCDNCTLSGGHASGNAVGYLVTYSSNSTVSGVKSFGNDESMDILYGKGMGFYSFLLNGSGIIEMNQLPKTQSGVANSNAPPQRTFYSNNRYSNVEVYDNVYGMAFIGTGNVTVEGSSVHDNSLWGILDMAGSGEYPLAVSTSDTALYRNGRDFLSIFALVMGSQTGDMAGTFESSETPTMPTLPEGFIWGEYLQFSMLYNMMLKDGYDTPAQWSMSQATHGSGQSSVQLRADDPAESIYVTSETSFPTWTQFNFTNDAGESVTVFMNITGPANNKSAVNDAYFVIMGIPESSGSECKTYCAWGCSGQEPGCYYYDEYNSCWDCKDVNNNQVCDNFECLDIDPQDGECDSKCTDSDQNGMCDFCDPQLPVIDNFAASPGVSEGYDMGSLELYYLNITSMTRPEDLSSETVVAPPPQPINRTWYIDAEWLPVPGQYLEGGAANVNPLELPPSQMFGDIGDDGNTESSVYQGIYGLFAYPKGGDGGRPPEEGQPQENATPSECTGDDDCAVNEICTNGQCVRFPCGCGEYKNHECAEYECCSDSQCPANQACINHYCHGGEEKPGCTSDSQCPAAGFCDIPAGSASGSCEPVEIGPCGEVRNHQFVPYGYECGSEEGCPSCPEGEACAGHMCVQSEVTCPTTGFVGDSKTCEAKENNAPCPNCDYVITAPNGWKFDGRTDGEGNFVLPLDMKGTYNIALLKDGKPVRIIQVQAFPQAQPEAPEKPTAAGVDGMFALWLVTLIALIVVSILYWKRRGEKK